MTETVWQTRQTFRLVTGYAWGQTALVHRLEHKNLFVSSDRDLTSRRDEWLTTRSKWLAHSSLQAVPMGLGRLAVGLSPRRPVFDPGPVHVRFMVDKVALGQGFLWVLRFCHVDNIPPMLRTYLDINTAYSDQKDERANPGNSECSVRYRGQFHRKVPTFQSLRG